LYSKCKNLCVTAKVTDEIPLQAHEFFFLIRKQIFSVMQVDSCFHTLNISTVLYKGKQKLPYKYTVATASLLRYGNKNEEAKADV
jgi:hypothetical protein